MQNSRYDPIEKHLAPEWFTERVYIRDCRIQDVSLLTEIFNACNYVEPLDPTFYIVDENEIKLLVEKSLSETDENKGFRLQCLELKDTGKMIGYFHLQHYSPRLPQRATAFISMFVIHPDFQGKQFAQEIVEGISRQLAECGYMAIWLAVYLKNWSAIRFWIQQGFNKIIEYDGATQFSETAQASLTLEKRLR
ncbi:MAG TPA: GNAT family N-acetyltransferase [Anaerolineales bacterium]|nr:GNAT family N-acetyltransferase [Anaerolineales bacterium]